MLERERRRRGEAKIFFGYSRGFVNRKSSILELKFFVTMRATHRYRKREISSNILRRRFGKFKDFELGSVLGLLIVSTTFQEVEILLTLVLFLPLS